MSDELQFKYEVEIKSAEKRQMLTNEVKDELKASGMMDENGKLKIKGVSAKMLKRMKMEFVIAQFLSGKYNLYRVLFVQTSKAG